MPESTTNERLARLEARFDSLQSHLDDSHGRLEAEIREQRVTMSEQLKEIRKIFSEYIAKDTEEAKRLEITVAQHDWMLRGVGGVLIAFLVAATPVLLEHYLSPDSSSDVSHNVSTAP